MISISVIIPSYKPGDYLWKCLDSLAAQSISKQSFEIILVLNGCKEPYETDIRTYVSNHNDLHFNFIQTDSPGVSNARNLALDACRGEYITFIDDDDFVSPSYLKELLDNSGKELVVLSNTIAVADPSGQEIENYRITKIFKRFSEKGKQPFYKPRKYFSGPCMKLLPRVIIGSNRFDPRFSNGEDSLFMFLISKNMRYCCFTSSNAIYYRRFRTGSAVMRHRSLIQRGLNSLRLICSYTSLYFKGFPHYSFPFYLTRVLGAIKSIIK